MRTIRGCSAPLSDDPQDNGMQEIGDDERARAEVETGVEVAIFAEQHGGGEDAVDWFEVHREIGGVGAQVTQQVDVEGMREL